MVNIITNIPDIMHEAITGVTGVFNRLSSNQGYTAEATASKPRVDGIGRAPKTSSTTRPKPYDRPAVESTPLRGSARAVHRATTNYIEHLTGDFEVTGSQVEVGDDVLNAQVNTEPHSDAHSEVTSDAETETEEGDITIKTVIHTPPASPTPEPVVLGPEVVIPPPVQAAAPNVNATNVQATAAVPTTLPVPILPRLKEMYLDDEVIPTGFIRHHLAPHLNRIENVIGLFAPISAAHSEASAGHLHATFNGLTTTMAFGIPTIIEGKDIDGGLANFIRGYEPDLCLALRSSADSNPHLRLLPIKNIAYAARCRLFPQVPLSMRFVHPDHAADYAAELAQEAEQQQFQGHGAYTPATYSDCGSSDTGTDKGSDTVSEAGSTVSDVSSTDAASEAAQGDNGNYVHLPILQLEVPSVETFMILHTKLHNPHNNWMPALLQLPAEYASNPNIARAALAQVKSKELMDRILTVKGVYRNMCALGVDGNRMWRQLNISWRLLVESLYRRIQPDQQNV